MCLDVICMCRLETEQQSVLFGKEIKVLKDADDGPTSWFSDDD